MPKVAVACHFFYNIPEMKAELLAKYPDAKFAPDGVNYMDRANYIDLVKGCDTVLAAIRPILDEEMLKALPELKVVAACSAGLDHIDPTAFNKRGVHVGWQAGVNKEAVSEFTLGLILDLLRDISLSNGAIRAGKQWGMRGSAQLLRGKVVGIHGCGHIGQALVKLLQPFGCTILANDVRDFSNFYKNYNVRAVSAETLWAESEILSIHLSKNSTTRGLYSGAVLDKLRKGALLINTSRGGIVDDKALTPRLKSGAIAGAAFDVFEGEPNLDAELVTLPNMLATSHLAGLCKESLVAMSRAGISGITDNWLPRPGVYPFD
jgi:D-3-phosphoglycerate dehydrogenase